MKNKKGQVTIFIIVAVLIIAGVALFLILKGNLQKDETTSPEIAPIVNFVEECIEETGEDAVYDLALRGGYNEVPAPYKKFFPNNIPYYWYLNTSLIPSKKNLESEFSKYLEKNIKNCTKDFEMFEKQGYSIKQGEISAKVILYLDKLSINLQYPLTIKKGEFSGRVKDFNQDVYTNFYEKYLLIQKIIREQEKYQNSIPMGFITNLAYDEGFTFDTINLDDDVIYFLIFNQGEPKEFIYSFAIKYGWDI